MLNFETNFLQSIINIQQKFQSSILYPNFGYMNMNMNN